MSGGAKSFSNKKGYALFSINFEQFLASQQNFVLAFDLFLAQKKTRLRM